MPRKVFFSFHFDNDCTRTQLVRNIGALEGQTLAQPNRWEEIRRTDAGVERWINEQMHGKSCVVVLIGSQTATRRWVDYEIRKGWNDGKGVVGIHIHGLKNFQQQTGFKGASPFNIGLNSGKSMSQFVPVFDPAGWDSKQVYASIANNIENWIEQGIYARQLANRAA